MVSQLHCAVFSVISQMDTVELLENKTTVRNKLKKRFLQLELHVGWIQMSISCEVVQYIHKHSFYFIYLFVVSQQF